MSGASSSSTAAPARASGRREFEVAPVSLDDLVGGYHKVAAPSQESADRQLPFATKAIVPANKRPEHADGTVVVANPFAMKPIPSKVLTEDDYTDACSHIIERDFFPDLASLRIKHELYLARASGDQALAQELQWKLVNLSRPTPLSTVAGTPGRLTPAATPLPGSVDLSGASTPGGATPNFNKISAWERDDDAESTVTARTSDAPGSACLKLVNGKQVIVDLQHVRLDDFHRVFTSEDNAAFEDILKRDYEKKACKQWWIEESERKHNTEHKKYRQAIQNGDDVNVDHQTMQSLGNEFKARNTLSFKPETLSVVDIVEKPKVDFKNTRFTTAQQLELDCMLGDSVARRQALMHGDKELEEGDRMAKAGRFGLSAFQWQGGESMRSIGGRMSTPLMPDTEVKGYPMVHTPAMLPGVGGLSPLMTYGKLGGTPRCLEDEGPSFRMNEASERERAAEKLQRGATQRLRESKQHTKAGRLRALGLTPRTPGTPGTPGSSRTTPRAGSSGRFTPGSGIVAPLSPIGEMIKRAQAMSQQGGRFRISSTPTPTPARTPTPAPSSKRRRKADGSATRGEGERLPASITDDLL